MAFLSRELPRDIIPAGKEVRLLRQLLQIMVPLRRNVGALSHVAHARYTYAYIYAVVVLAVAPAAKARCA